MELDPQVSPEEIMSMEVELGCESWTSFASGCSSTAVALVAAQWRGDTALTLPLFWRRSTVSPVFFGRYPRSSLHSFVPFPPVPVPNRQPRFCGRKATWSGLVSHVFRCSPTYRHDGGADQRTLLSVFAALFSQSLEQCHVP